MSWSAATAPRLCTFDPYGELVRAGAIAATMGSMSLLSTTLRIAWASPNTLIGLLAWPLVLFGGGTARVVDGVLELQGPWIRWILIHLPFVGPAGAAAMTLGHVVIGCSAGELNRTRAHERVHVRQYERWGPLFLPAYVAFSVAAQLRGEDPYMGNRFEREAYSTADVVDTSTD